MVKRTSIHFAFARMVSRLCWSTSAYLLVSLPLKKASVSSASFSDASWPNAAYVRLESATAKLISESIALTRTM
jgi:hypothetical protein